MSENTRKFDPTKPVKTRDGRKARILCEDLKCKDGNIVAAVIDLYDRETLFICDSSGKAVYHGDDCDLINIPQKREGWVIVRKTEKCGNKVGRSVFGTRSDAEDFARHVSVPNVVGLSRIEWEE